MAQRAPSISETRIAEALLVIDPGWSCLWEANTHIGESTLWDERDGCIYWVDINPDNPSINWLQIASGTQRSWNPPVWVSALAVREQGGFIASTRDGLAFITHSLETFEHFADPRSHPASTRMNDGVFPTTANQIASRQPQHIRTMNRVGGIISTFLATA
ncbi:MAG: SMP-30/gluconolactonase/LRE family protein [Caenibius sp.]